MDLVLNAVIYTALVIHVLLAFYCVYKVWRGDNIIDRLIGLDVIGTIGMALLVLIGMSRADTFFIDAALGLAALSYVGSIALAKYLADRQGAGALNAERKTRTTGRRAQP
jgi:multicomponent Na+:H+ antiporter subunit F